MDQVSGELYLKRLYALENRSSTKLGTEESYIEFHTQQIKRLNKGYWVDPDAKKYIENLEKSI